MSDVPEPGRRQDGGNGVIGDQARVLGVPLGVIGLGAAGGLVGFSIILWVAANWQAIGKFEKFGLVGGVLLAAAVIGVLVSHSRAAMTLVGVLATGGLFALYGQTYQVSADAYSLFLIWSLVTLPWVAAARSDAAWALWVLIAFTAIGLWVGFGDGARFSDPAVVLAGWAVAIGIAALLSPWAGLEELIGRTWWAFRVAVLSALSLIGAHTVSAIFYGSASDLIAVAGFGVIAASVAVFALARPFSLSLLACAALALDAVLITSVTRFLDWSFGSARGLLMLGMLYAGIVGGSAVAVMHIARDRGAAGFSGGTSRFGFGSHWAVAIMSAMGALLTAGPVFGFLAIAFGSQIYQGSATYVAGVIAMAGAAFMMWGASTLGMRQQLGFIGFAVGGCLIIFALFRDLPATGAGLVIFCVTVGLATIAPARWIVALLGVLGGAMLSWVLILQFAGESRFGFDVLKAQEALQAGYLLSAVLAAAALGCVSLAGRDNGRGGDARERAEGYFVGWCGVAIAGELLRNPTFLMPGHLGRVGAVLMESVSPDLSFSMLKAGAAGVVVVSAGVLIARRSDVQSVAAVVLAAGLACLAYVVPSIAIPAAVFAAAALNRHRALMLGAIVALIWLIGAFYYWLGWPLAAKAYVLGVLGLAIAALILIFGKSGQFTLEAQALGRRAAPLWLASALTLVAVAATFAAVGKGIMESEDILANGRKVFVRLAPVDPRSLMRGDYMRLRFAAPRLSATNGWGRGAALPVWAVATVDADDVATITSFAGREAGQSAGDLRLRVRFRHRQMVLGTNAYFFEEGTEPKYRNARYGVFRVGPNGDAMLTGLADENRQQIQ